MRLGFLCLFFAAFFLYFGISGLLSDSVEMLGRGRSNEFILQIEQPAAFGITVALYFLLGALCLFLSGLVFWADRKIRAAEERFLRHKAPVAEAAPKREVEVLSDPRFREAQELLGELEKSARR